MFKSSYCSRLVTAGMLAFGVAGLRAADVATEAFIKASNAEMFDRFGVTVSVSGDTMVVGAPFENGGATGVNGNQNDNSAPHAGAAYVFVRVGTNWMQQAYLKSATATAGSLFGFAVGI